jgi:hypothetical protein
MGWPKASVMWFAEIAVCECEEVTQAARKIEVKIFVVALSNRARKQSNPAVETGPEATRHCTSRPGCHPLTVN